MRTVRDIMQKEVISVRSGTSVGDLARLLDEEGISGVPVLDSAGSVMGVVSRTDVVRLASSEAEAPGATDAFWAGLAAYRDEVSDEDPDAYFLAPESAAVILPAGGAVAGMTMDQTPVDEIMTPVAFHVDPEMLIWELAKFLVGGRIHRALVVEDGRLVGIVTAFDVLRVVAGDAEG
jgi:CBS domain-containing protein